MNLRLGLLTVFGLGLLRPAPGTWGSLPPIALTALLLWIADDWWVIELSLLACAALFSIACVRFGDEAEAYFGRKDPSSVVADETAGQCLALLALPWRFGEDAMLFNGFLLAISFVAFRLFDVIKPPPINGLQKYPGGFGVLIDDLAAGALALVTTQLAGRALLPLAF